MEDKKTKRKILYAITLVLVCFITYILFFKLDLTNNSSEYVINNKQEQKVSFNIEEKKKVIKSTMKEIIDKFKNNESFVVYFGFPDCPSCQLEGPIIYEAARQSESELYYVRTRADKSENYKHLYTQEEKQELLKYMDDFMLKDENGVNQLYVPCVVSVKNGKVVTGRVGHVEGNSDQPLSEKETLKIVDVYKKIFETQVSR